MYEVLIRHLSAQIGTYYIPVHLILMQIEVVLSAWVLCFSYIHPVEKKKIKKAPENQNMHVALRSRVCSGIQHLLKQRFCDTSLQPVQILINATAASQQHSRT